MTDTWKKLAALFDEKKATSIIGAVGEQEAARIAYALDTEAADQRIHEQRQKAIQMAKERGLGL